MIWERFTGGKERTLWYYQSLAEVYKQNSLPNEHVNEISTIINELISLSSKKSDYHLDNIA